MTKEIGFEVKINLNYDEAVDKVIAALKEQGFGVLSRIDVRATLQEKLGEDFRPYIILGACNPPLAHRALSQDAVVGLMLPCNVTIEADPDGGAIARIANPEMVMTVGALQENAILTEIAQQARAMLEQVAASLLEST
jgi:uncharacterized protein (DUF302 family)